MFAGDYFESPFVLIPAFERGREPCAALISVSARAQELGSCGWVGLYSRFSAIAALSPEGPTSRALPREPPIPTCPSMEYPFSRFTDTV